MGMSAGGGGGKYPAPEINVTPLVDIVLVLLIIFMVVTPAIAQGEQLTLPEIEKPDEKPKDLNPIKLTLAPGGRIILDDEPVQQAELKRRLRNLHELDPEQNLRINTDEKVKYKRVRETLAIVQDIGFKGVALKVIEKKKKGG